MSLSFASSRLCGLCDTRGHRVLDTDLRGGAAPRTDEHPRVHNDLFCDRGVLRLLREGPGHRHQGAACREARAATPTGLDPAPEPRGLCEHAGQLPEPGTGHIQHVHRDPNILRRLHHVRPDVLSDSV